MGNGLPDNTSVCRRRRYDVKNIRVTHIKQLAQTVEHWHIAVLYAITLSVVYATEIYLSDSVPGFTVKLAEKPSANTGNLYRGIHRHTIAEGRAVRLIGNLVVNPLVTADSPKSTRLIVVQMNAYLNLSLANKTALGLKTQP